MDLSPTLLFYGTLMILIVLEVVVLVMIFSYYKLLKSYDGMRKQQQLEQDKAGQEANQLLRAAQKQAELVLKQATEQAGQIVAGAEHFNQDTQVKISEAVNRFMVGQTTSFETMFEQARKQTVSEVQGVSQKLGEEVVKEIKATADGFKSQLKVAQDQSLEALKGAYANLEQELNTYKQQRVADLEKSVQTVVKQVVERVLKRSLNVKQHEELILGALDEAKKQNLL